MSPGNTLRVKENAKSEETRKKLYVVHDSLAKDKNIPVLQPNARAAEQNRAAARLQIVGRFPDRNQNGEDRRAARKHTSTISSPASNRNSTAEVAELQKMKAADTKDPERQNQ